MRELMNIIKVPTGNIFITKGFKNKPMEFLSIGDYGKEKNIKADFLGFEKEINGVPDGEVKPLSDKWVVTISTQYGCSMGCTFCDVPKVGRGDNCTLSDLIAQTSYALEYGKEVKTTKRFNLHYARMGEPTFNWNVLRHAEFVLREIVYSYLNIVDTIHPVISTMMPKNNNILEEFIRTWIHIKNKVYKGEAGLQLSINSTNEDQRRKMFSGNAMSLQGISNMFKQMPRPIGRKYALNFALDDSYIVDAKRLKELFNPDNFMVKITPLHKTQSCIDNKLITTSGYSKYTSYKSVESSLKREGFDVLVFIPSNEEDESRITCGNAVLSDKNMGEI